jgi:type I restriction enzyme S subunit
MIILLPPLEVQQSICEFIDAEAREITTASQLIEREITLIQDFRTRIVADVVTGKLDVRALAATLPETANQDLTFDLAEDEDLDDLPEDADTEEAAA